MQFLRKQSQQAALSAVAENVPLAKQPVLCPSDDEYWLLKGGVVCEQRRRPCQSFRDGKRRFVCFCVLGRGVVVPAFSKEPARVSVDPIISQTNAEEE